jgi:hypothetical protein
VSFSSLKREGRMMRQTTRLTARNPIPATRNTRIAEWEARKDAEGAVRGMGESADGASRTLTKGIGRVNCRD